MSDEIWLTAEVTQLHPDFLLMRTDSLATDKIEFAVTTRKEPMEHFAVSFAVTGVESNYYDFPTIVNQRYWKAAARISRWMEKASEK